MEALSSGVKCAISANTGHLDIIRSDNCFALSDQRHVEAQSDFSVEGWGESNLDEILATMEDAYLGKRTLDKDTIRGSVAHLTWEAAINNLLKEINVQADGCSS